MRRLLQYCQDPEGIWWHGALWATGMATTELLRVLFFGMTWGVAYRQMHTIYFFHYRSIKIKIIFFLRTAIRLRAAMITMLFKKVLRLSSLGDKSIGEVNLF